MKDKDFWGSNFFIFKFLACGFLSILEDWYFPSLNLLMICLRFCFLVSGQSIEIALPNAVHSTLELGRIGREKREMLFVQVSVQVSSLSYSHKEGLLECSMLCHNIYFNFISKLLFKGIAGRSDSTDLQPVYQYSFFARPLISKVDA